MDHNKYRRFFVRNIPLIGGGGPVLPETDLPIHLDVYLRAEDIAIANGATVNAWSDRYGNFTLGRAVGNKPVYLTSGIGAMPSVSFNAGNNNALEALGTNLAMFAAGFTFFLVAYVATTSSLFMTFFIFTNDAPNQRPAYYFRRQRTSDTPANGMRFYLIPPTGIIAVTPNPTTWAAGASKLISGTVRPDGSIQLWQNGISIASQAAQSVVPVDTPMSQLILGWNGNLGDYLNGRIATFGWKNSVLSDADRQSVEAFLIAKYSIV